MDDILSSIRRIMLDEQARLKGGGPSSDIASTEEPAPSMETGGPGSSTILTLDASMIIEALQPAPEAPVTHVEFFATEMTTPHPAEEYEMPKRDLLQIASQGLPPEPASADVPTPVEQVVWTREDETVLGAAASAPVAHEMISTQAIEALIAPAAAAAAAASVEALLRELRQERSELIQQQAPTIETIVRSEIRPMLKAWLDEHLPTLVDRVVRSEIERLVGGRSGR